MAATEPKPGEYFACASGIDDHLRVLKIKGHTGESVLSFGFHSREADVSSIGSVFVGVGAAIRLRAILDDFITDEGGNA